MPVKRDKIGIKSLLYMVLSTHIGSASAAAAVGGTSDMPRLFSDRQVSSRVTKMAEDGSTYLKSEHGMSTKLGKLLRRTRERSS